MSVFSGYGFVGVTPGTLDVVLGGVAFLGLLFRKIAKPEKPIPGRRFVTAVFIHCAEVGFKHQADTRHIDVQFGQSGRFSLEVAFPKQVFSRLREDFTKRPTGESRYFVGEFPTFSSTSAT